MMRPMILLLAMILVALLLPAAAAQEPEIRFTVKLPGHEGHTTPYMLPPSGMQNFDIETTMVAQNFTCLQEAVVTTEVRSDIENAYPSQWGPGVVNPAPSTARFVIQAGRPGTAPDSPPNTGPKLQLEVAWNDERPDKDAEWEYHIITHNPKIDGVQFCLPTNIDISPGRFLFKVGMPDKNLTVDVACDEPAEKELPECQMTTATPEEDSPGGDFAIVVASVGLVYAMRRRRDA